MTTIVEARGLTKRYRGITAVDGVDFQLARNTITGLLGRNGAGKTTLMHLLTGQEFATHGSITIAGESPVENPRVLQHTCFIKESQRYPDDFKPKHVFAAAPGFFPNWDADFARELAAELRLPVDRRIKKLSRGQLSSVGIIVGLASRAPITIFDEPYLSFAMAGMSEASMQEHPDFLKSPKGGRATVTEVVSASPTCIYAIVRMDASVVPEERRWPLAKRNAISKSEMDAIAMPPEARALRMALAARRERRAAADIRHERPRDSWRNGCSGAAG